jgi:hypothetical protein
LLCSAEIRSPADCSPKTPVVLLLMDRSGELRRRRRRREIAGVGDGPELGPRGLLTLDGGREGESRALENDRGDVTECSVPAAEDSAAEPLATGSGGSGTAEELI